MKNNWKEKSIEITEKNRTLFFSKYLDNGISPTHEQIYNEFTVPRFEEFGNLVFEATKHQCLNKVRIQKEDEFGNIIDIDDLFLDKYSYSVNKESISNIEKPSL